MGWKDCTPEELENSIKHNPLNENAVNQTFEELINEVEFRSGTHPKYGIVYPVDDERGKDTGKFKIVISTNNPKEVMDITEVHELIHVYYRVGGVGYDWGTMFYDIVETEAQRIVRENPTLLDHIRKCYMEKSRQTCERSQA